MVLIINSDAFMFTIAVLYLLSEVSIFFKELRIKQSMQRKASRFSDCMQKLFGLHSFEAVDWLERSCSDVDDFVQMVFAKHAPELLPHHQKFMWVLLSRKGLLKSAAVTDVARDCYRYFMCVVMQLRVFGELRSRWALERFKLRFLQFAEIDALNDVAHRTWTVAMELRKIAHELEHASPGNMELLERFDTSLMEVRALLE